MKSKGLSDREYKDEAAVYRRDINDKLASFDKFTGRLEYNYTGSLKAHFVVSDGEANPPMTQPLDDVSPAHRRQGTMREIEEQDEGQVEGRGSR